MMPDVIERATWLQALTDAVVERHLGARAKFVSSTPVAHDDVLALAPGTRMVDQLTGQLVEVIVGQRTQYIVQTS
jgi:hypothetical protein